MTDSEETDSANEVSADELNQGSDSFFQFFTNQEVPQFTFDMETENFASKVKDTDSIDFACDIWDNGDSKITAVFFLQEQKAITINCNMFIPELQPCKVVIAGQGSGVYLKSVEFSCHERDSPLEEEFKRSTGQGNLERGGCISSSGGNNCYRGDCC